MPTITLPTLHPGQIAAYQLPGKRKVIRCGRRWGKTDFGATIACDGAAKRQIIGWFAPEHKFIAEAYNSIEHILQPIKASGNKVEGVIRTTTGGNVDFWSLDNPLAGRSRRYHKVIIDEAAFAKAGMLGVWEKNIEPTLLDFSGTAYVLSNTNGNDPENFLWQLCNNPKHGFIEYHAPTWQNPHVPKQDANESDADYLTRRAAVYREIEEKTPALVFAQEYGALFVSWAGVPIFDSAKLLVNGQGVDYPKICDSVFVVIDSAMKDGQPHDGTGASYWAASDHIGHRLVCLDWEYVQVQGAFLIDWIPSVFERGRQLAKQCGARMGFRGGFVEDASSGTILLQQCAARELPAQALPSKLTAVGKDQRALNASPHVFQGLVKFSRHAHDKSVPFKGNDRNHMWHQMVDFRIADKDGYKRADDLLDTGTYAIALTFGNQEGIG